MLLTKVHKISLDKIGILFLTYTEVYSGSSSPRLRLLPFVILGDMGVSPITMGQRITQLAHKCFRLKATHVTCVRGPVAETSHMTACLQGKHMDIW